MYCILTFLLSALSVSLSLQSFDDNAPLTELKNGRVGGFVAIKCGFSDVDWFKFMDGDYVNLKSLRNRRISIIRDGRMYISRLRDSDAGVYLCRKNETPIKKITVKIAEKPSVVIQPGDVTVQPGSLVHLPCEGDGIPHPTISWRIGRIQLSDLPVLPASSSMEDILGYKGDNYVMTEAGHLYIRNITVQHGGLYICEVTNEGGTAYATSNILVLDPPEITTKPADTDALDARTIGFACRATGSPTPTIKWRIETDEGLVIEDVEDHPSGRYQVDRYQSIRISMPVPSDSGRYTCIASNTGGSVNATGILRVLVTPEFRIPPKDSWVPVGSSAVFVCAAQGSPTPLIEWFKDDAYLAFSNTYQIQHETSLHEVQEKLIFRQISFQDTGFYECRASNLAGTNRHEFSIAVTEAMPFPGDRFVKDAIEYANNFVQSAIQETQVILSSRFSNPNFQPTPQDLFHMVRQPTRQTLYMAMSAEVFEHALDYIHQQIEKLNATSLERNQQPLTSLLSPAALEHLEDLSGCKARVKMPKCQMRCQLMSFRSHDGTCNNEKNPLYGSSLHSLNRFLPALYENKYNTPRGWSHHLPSARLVSQRLMRTDGFQLHSRYSVLMMHFGQFLDHDLIQTVSGPSETTFAPFLPVRCRRTCSNTMPCFPIEIATNDTRIESSCMPFVRSAATCGTGDTSVFGDSIRVREQLNQVTSFLDGSGIYGSADEEMETLRDRSAGRGQLRVGEETSPGKHLLPREDVLVPEELESERRCIGRSAINFHDCFLAGDRRSTEQPGLTVLHTVFMRHHNQIAYKLSEVNPQWNDDRVYEEARKIVGAQLQHIAYNEYLPKVLGVEGMMKIGEYMGYESETDSSILNEFATAAFRFGHTLIPPTLFRRGENYEEFELGDMPLHNSFFTPYRIVDEGGIDPIIRGMLTQNLKNPDGKLSSSVTERLFNIISEVSLDLAAINIQRGRDHAIPTYNDMRQVCGMRRALNFHDLQSEITNATVRQLLSEMYDTVDDIDLWVGGLEESTVDGSLVGPTFRCIIAEQFKRTRNGDRFWYEADSHFTSEQLRQIRKTTLAKILCENADNITKVPEDVFKYNPNVNKYTECRKLPRFDFSAFMDCGGPDFLRYQSHLYDRTPNPHSQSSDFASSSGATVSPSGGNGVTESPSGGNGVTVSPSSRSGVSPTPNGSGGDAQFDPIPKNTSVEHDIEVLNNHLQSMYSQITSLNAKSEYLKEQISQLEVRLGIEAICSDGNMRYYEGEKWNTDECTECQCQQGEITCGTDTSCGMLEMPGH